MVSWKFGSRIRRIASRINRVRRRRWRKLRRAPKDKERKPVGPKLIVGLGLLRRRPGHRLRYLPTIRALFYLSLVAVLITMLLGVGR